MASSDPNATAPATLLEIRSGTYAIGGSVLTENGAVDVPLGTIYIFPASQDPAEGSGQWTLLLREASDECRNVMIDIATRLGLLPVQLAPSFERHLRDEKAMVLVADTNALLHGILAQALRARAGRPTHVAVADQAFMEVHRQREEASKSKRGQGPGASALSEAARWARRSDRAAYLSAARRTLERIRRNGYLTHVARPPEAMVRYLGGTRGAVEGEERLQPDEVGSNALRDRLMLEAAAQHRVEMPGVPVWFVTGDARLAEQAKMEGLNVGFGWRSESLVPPLISSPCFDVYTLELRHVKATDFLEELMWTCEVVTIQRPSADHRLVGRLPTAARGLALAAMGEPGHDIVWKTEPATPLETDLTSDLPRRAPSPERLLSRLIELTVGNVDSPEPQDGEIERQADAYLKALHWIDNAGGVTPRGNALAQCWLALGPEDAGGWVSWIRDASVDIAKLPRVARLLESLHERGDAKDDQLQKEVQESREAVARQLKLAHAFGLIVRIANENWAVRDASDEEVAAAIFAVISSTIAREPNVRTASIAAVFMNLLSTSTSKAPTAFSLPAFRAGILHLSNSGRIRLSGGSPATSRAKMRTLVRDGEHGVDHREVDLGRGDFLVPNTPAIVATFPEGYQ